MAGDVIYYRLGSRTFFNETSQISELYSAHNVHYQNSITKPHTRSYAVGCSKSFLSEDPDKQSQK